MNVQHRMASVAGATVLIALAIPAMGGSTRTAARTASVETTVFAAGLNDPRGLTFGPDKWLYVAEAGSGGADQSTVGECDQVVAIGPFKGGATGRIVALSAAGGFDVVADGLPSTEAIPAIGGDKMGVSSVAFIGNQLHGLIAGGGCSHGHRDANNGVFTVGAQGPSLIADLSEWILATPGAKGAETPRSPDYEPDGTWYSMLFERGRLITLEPNHGLLVSVHPTTGKIELMRDLLAEFGDHTYASMASDRGNLFIGTLGQIVFTPNGPDLVASFDAGIYRVQPNGQASQIASGLKAVLGIAFDKLHRMYALQSPIFVPGTGSLVRVEDDGTLTPIVTGLTFPSAITRGPDDAFYVSECGYHCQPGDGRILKIRIND